MHTVRFILITLWFLAACTPVRPPAQSVYEISGSQAQRIDAVGAIISKSLPPPTTILDAYFVEEKIGDGQLGPADYRAFYRIDVAPEDVAAWQALLTPLTITPHYSHPVHLYDWWIEEALFSSVAFYAPDRLTGRTQGWVGISRQSGQIYIFTFTM